VLLTQRHMMPGDGIEHPTFIKHDCSPWTDTAIASSYSVVDSAQQFLAPPTGDSALYFPNVAGTNLKRYFYCFGIDTDQQNLGGTVWAYILRSDGTPNYLFSSFHWLLYLFRQGWSPSGRIHGTCPMVCRPRK